MNYFDVEGYLNKGREEAKKRFRDRDPLAVRIGTNLWVLRKINNETQEMVSNEVNINKSLLAYIEQGFVLPGIDLLERFTDYYMVSLETLVHSDLSDLKDMLMRRPNRE